MEGHQAHELAGDELETGLNVWNKQRSKEGKSAFDAAFFGSKSPQHMYRVDLTRFWINETEKDAEGHIVRDYRQEIQREDLLA
jgi:hypothetical protein